MLDDPRGWLAYACRIAFRIAPDLPRDEAESAAGWALARALPGYRSPETWVTHLTLWVKSAIDNERRNWRSHGLVKRGCHGGKLTPPARVGHEPMREDGPQAADARMDTESILAAVGEPGATLLRRRAEGAELQDMGYATPAGAHRAWSRALRRARAIAGVE